MNIPNYWKTWNWNGDPSFNHKLLYKIGRSSIQFVVEEFLNDFTAMYGHFYAVFYDSLREFNLTGHVVKRDFVNFLRKRCVKLF